jgi:dihydropyrimidinase
MIETTANKSAINLGFHAIIANLDQVSQIPIFSESLGVTSFKFLMAAQERELYPDTFAASDGTMFLAFDQIAKLGYPATAMVHAENWEICFALKEKFITEGRARSQEDYIESRPRICETEAISRCLRLSRYFNSRLYFPHVSTAEGVDLISRSRWGGLKVAGETCPHYLAFTKNNKFPLPAKVNPPLRESQDIEALWGGLLNGAITCVASDYVPGNSGRLDPDNVFDSAGMPGRTPGIILPFLLTEVSRGRLTPEQVARVTSANIAKWFGVFPQKGCLWLGSDADLTIVDTKISKRINPHTLHATTDLTWYDGLDVNGWPIRTMINGLTVTEFDQFHGENTKGSYLRRKLGVPSC